jgi:SAM-dependent methyltransferase
MPAAFPTLALSIELSTNLEASHTRDRCPSARVDLVSSQGVRHVATLRVDIESPRLELPDASVAAIDAGDVIGRTIDEAAWLAELARVLEPGGRLNLRVPAGGPLAWYDTRNIYRYVTDILGRGDNPDDTLPTGWNRHYAMDDILSLLLDAGFTSVEVGRRGLGLAEPPQLVGLMVGNFLLCDRDTEYRLHPLRQRMERIDARIPAPAIGTMLAITATRAASEPEDPSDDAPDNRPAPEIDSE